MCRSVYARCKLRGVCEATLKRGHWATFARVNGTSARMRWAGLRCAERASGLVTGLIPPHPQTHLQRPQCQCQLSGPAQRQCACRSASKKGGSRGKQREGGVSLTWHGYDSRAGIAFSASSTCARLRCFTLLPAMSNAWPAVASQCTGLLCLTVPRRAPVASLCLPIIFACA